MDSVKSFFANTNKENNLNNQQNGITGRWSNWSRGIQAHADSGAGQSAMSNANPGEAKRKDSDSYFYIM
ncbi:CG8788 [Drosophila busckii]|nr:CG8788 [Drosophila busckii]